MAEEAYDPACPTCLRPLGGLTYTPPPKPKRARIVRAGWLLATPDRPPVRNVWVAIAEGRILAVSTDAIPSDRLRNEGYSVEEPLDLSEHFVLPGLIDCHVHLLFEFATGTGVEFFQKTDADWLVDGMQFARATLRAGFTTVRDCGNLNGTPAIFTLRNAIAAGKIAGPRIVATSAIVTVTGGAGDMVGFLPSVVGEPAHTGVGDGGDALRRAVRLQVKAGADFIKVAMTGGVLSDTNAGVDSQMTDAEIAAVVDEAHRWGKKVAVHAHSTAGVNAALKAGADSIEHGTYIDEHGVKLLNAQQAWFVPTLLAGKTVMEFAKQEGFYPPAIRDKAARIGPDMLRNFANVAKSGASIAFGTDTGVSRHGDNAKEFALLVEGGLTPLDAVRAATTNAANLLGLSDQIGEISEGKCADLVAFAANPLDDVTHLETPLFVMRAGAPVPLDRDGPL